MKFVNTEEKYILRDIDSMALSNVDQNSKNEYYQKRQQLENQKLEIDNLKQDINSVKDDIGAIKQLLMQLLDKQE